MESIPIVLTAARGSDVVFEESFFTDPDTQTDPIVPLNPATQPAVVIRAPDGQIVRELVARPVTPGTWRVEVRIPSDGMVSTVSSKWSAEWNIHTASGRDVTLIRRFDVVEQRTPGVEDKALSILVRDGGSARPSIRLPADPYFISASLYRRRVRNSVETFSYVPGNLAASTIKRTVEGSEVVYYFDTPTLKAGEYVAIWDTRASETAQLDSQERLIRVHPQAASFMFRPLRALIDMLRKRANWVQGYTTDDLYEYLLRGVDTLNMVFPTTSWGLNDLPLGIGGTENALTIAAAIQALAAQHILAVETEFDFGGQTVPLKVDRRAGYAEALDKMEHLLEDWKKSKLGIVRRMSGPGAVGVRMVQRRSLGIVVPVSSGQGGGSFSLLSSLGLLV